MSDDFLPWFGAIMFGGEGVIFLYLAMDDGVGTTHIPWCPIGLGAFCLAVSFMWVCLSEL